MTPDLPFVSIILPIRNEELRIRECLECISQQTYPTSHFEVIIVDGCSNDHTARVIEQVIREQPALSMQVLQNPEQIFSSGFNIGVQAAQGEVIVMVGGHTLLAPDFLWQSVQHLQTYPVDCVGGPIKTIAETGLSETISIAMSSSFGVGGVAFRVTQDKTIEVDTVAFGAYRASVFSKIGLLDEEMIRNQDDEFNYRLRESGGKILLASPIQSRYYSRSSLRKLWSQYYQYGLWKVRVLQKHPSQMKLRHFVPLALTTAFTGSIFLAFIPAIGLLPLTLVAGSYLAANLTAAIITACKRGWSHFLLLPLTFAILHFSYGFGFMVGLGKFANRWGDRIGRVPTLEPNYAQR